MSNSNINITAVYPTFDPATIAYVKASSTATTLRRMRILDTLVRGLKTSEIWDKLDCFWIFAAENQSSAGICLRNPSRAVVTEVNSPAWVINQGYTGNGTTSYVNTNFVLSTSAVNYTLDNASIGVYSRTIGQAASATQIDMGVTGTTATWITRMNTRFTGDLTSIAINSATGFNVTNTTTSGLISATRTASNVGTVYVNGVALGGDTDASTALPDLALFVCANNSNTVATGFSPKQFSLCFIGSSSINQLILYTLFQNYMTSLTTQV